jgi:predicted RNase H-like HicB family nuclease
MNTRAEFEQEKDGRWVATFPGVRGAVGYGSTRHEAAVGLTVSALHVLADRVESGDLKVQDEPVRILLSAAEDQFDGLRRQIPQLVQQANREFLQDPVGFDRIG